MEKFKPNILISPSCTCTAMLHFLLLLTLLKETFCEQDPTLVPTLFDTKGFSFRPSDILSPLQSCQIKLIIRSQKFPPLSLQLILKLTESWIPYESLYSVPNIRVHRYSRRYGENCRVRIVFPSSHKILVQPGGNPERMLFSRLNRETEIVIFVAKSHPGGEGTSFHYHKWICLQPLNTIVLQATTTGSRWQFFIKQQIFMSQRCEGGRLYCPISSNFLLGTNGKFQRAISSYNHILRHLQQFRRDFRGTRLHYYNANIQLVLSNTNQFEKLEIFRASHRNARFANLQVPTILGSHLNFTFTANFDGGAAKSNPADIFCQVGGFTHWDSYAQSDLAEGESLSLVFEGFSYYKIFYTQDDREQLSPLPFKLKKFFDPCRHGHLDVASWHHSTSLSPAFVKTAYQRRPHRSF